jgi:hypothetical protein
MVLRPGRAHIDQSAEHPSSGRMIRSVRKHWRCHPRAQIGITKQSALRSPRWSATASAVTVCSRSSRRGIAAAVSSLSSNAASRMAGRSSLTSGQPRRPGVTLILRSCRLDERLAVSVPRRARRAVVHRKDALAPAGDHVQAGIRRNLVEPGAKRASAAEPGQPAPGTQESLLQRVLGVVKRPEHPVAVRVKLSAVVIDDAAKDVLVFAAHGELAGKGHRSIRPADCWKLIGARASSRSFL